jgi:hypothetical protein
MSNLLYVLFINILLDQDMSVLLQGLARRRQEEWFHPHQATGCLVFTAPEEERLIS